MLQKTIILSCVGKRPLAVVIPIHTLLKSDHVSKMGVEVILICTEKTLNNEGSRCKEWLKREFPGVNIPDPVLFDSRCKFLNNLIGPNDVIYLNTNPAMHWEISLLCLKLPRSTVCISSDNDYFYIWKLTEDIKSVKQIELKNIGIDALTYFSEKISITPRNSINKRLSEQIKICINDLSKKKSFVIKIDDMQQHILQRINQRLIWLKENKGRLYLLFDMMEDSDIGSLLDDFRLITAVFDPINYTVTVVSSNSKIIQRAKIEGIDYIQSYPNTVWHKDINDWIVSIRKIKPKAIVPDNFISTPSVLTSKPQDVRKTLCICLGDNIDPTLKAILSHQGIDSISLFYDETSPKIKLLARNVAYTYIAKNKNIALIPTDHKGEGIIDKLLAISAQRINLVFNITPGTKMQSVVLTSAAVATGSESEVYSIYRDSSVGKETIRRVLDSQDCANIIPPHVQDLLTCCIAPLRYDDTAKENNRILSLGIWEYLLSEIASKRMQPFDSFDKFQIFNRRYNVKLFRSESKIRINNKTYQLNKSILSKGGLWWEAVVGYAVSRSVSDEIYWQIIWDWHDEKRNQYAEIDVVAKYRNHILAISCKTMKRNLEDAVYMIKSEAAKRFGRFAAPFVAIPHEDYKGKKVGGAVIDGVAILTPSYLREKNKLIDCFNKLLSELSTTS